MIRKKIHIFGMVSMVCRIGMVLVGLCIGFGPMDPMVFGQEKAAAPRLWAQGKGNAKPLPKASKKKKPQPPKPQGVRAMFQSAQKLYDQKKYYQALAEYITILKKYPTHEPTIIQMAKTYYRLDRLQDAYTMFSRLNPQYLDPETSFEYGMSFYTAKQWQGALYGFNRVTKDHSLYDLANYYGAICAIKLKRYDEAEEMLEKAVVLPEKLARSRKLYLKHVQALKLMKEKRTLAEERREELRNNKGTKKGKGSEKDEPPPPVKPEGYSHAGKQSVSRNIAATAAVSSVRKEFKFGSIIPGDESNFTRTNSLEVAHGLLLPLPWKSGKDRQSAFGLPIKAVGEWNTRTGSEERYVIRENAEDLVQSIQEDKGISDGKIANITITPWLEFPLPSNTWLAVYGEFQQVYPNFEAKDQSGYRRGGGKIWVGVESYSFNLESSYTDFYNAKGVSDSNETAVITGVNVGLPDSFDVGLEFRFKDFVYYTDAAIEGPDRTTGGVAKLKKGFPFGVKLYTDGSYEAREGYVVYNPNASFPVVSADGGTWAGKIGIEVAPWSFITLDAGVYAEQTKWAVILNGQPTKEEAFLKNVPEKLMDTYASIKLSDSF